MTEKTQKHEVRGIMTYLRSHTHIVLFLLIFSFVGLIVFQWGMNFIGIRSPQEQGVIAVVNGNEIKAQDYSDNIQQEYLFYQNQVGTAPDQQYMLEIEKQVFNRMVNEILINKAIADLGLSVSDEEILQHVRFRPSAVFLNSPDFRNDDGSFNISKYYVTLEQLSQSNAVLNFGSVTLDLLDLENEAKSQIPQIKLQNLVTASVRVSEEEIKQVFREEELSASVEYILAKGTLFADEVFDINDQEIADFYQDHSDEFYEEEKRQLRYVIFDTSPTSADSADLEIEIDEYLKRAQSGEDFAELALEYNEDSDGDLGTFGKGSMAAEFESAVFDETIADGDIIGPVDTPFGKHIIKIERLVKKDGEIDSVQARHILFQYEASPNTVDNVETKANYFVFTAKDSGFVYAAEKNGLYVSETIPFSRTGFIPGFGAVPEIEDFTFQSVFDEENPPISNVIKTPMGFVVFQLDNVIVARTKSIEEPGVRIAIEQYLRDQKQINAAEQLMARVRADIESGTSFKNAAEKEGLTVQAADSFKINDFIPDIGYDIKFTSTAFSLDPGNVSNPVTGNQGVYLIKAITKDPFDQQLYVKRRQEILDDLIQRKRSFAFSAWLQNLRDSSDIEDYRNKL